MKIEILPAVTYCEACGKTYPTVQYGRQCPHCGSWDTYLAAGGRVQYPGDRGRAEPGEKSGPFH